MKFVTFLISVAVAALCSTAGSLACSLAHNRSAKEIFKDSAYVFHGTAIRAEAIFLKNVPGVDESIPLIKVYWKVDKTFKGKNIGKHSTVTNLVCGGVIVAVGAPYVVSLQDLQSGDDELAGFADAVGTLDDQGTIGEFQEPEKFAKLVAEFENFKREK